MKCHHIQVGDVSLRVGFMVIDFNLEKYFLKAESEAQATLDLSVGIMIKPGMPTPSYDGKVFSTMLLEGPSLFDVARVVGYVAGDISEQYRFCQASGLNLNGKGIMLGGGSSQSKSTLATLLGGEMVDDIMLLASPTEMVRIAKIGAKIDPKTQIVEYLEDDNGQSPLHYVFILDDGIGEGITRRIDPSTLDPDLFFDPLLHPSLLKRFGGRHPIPFEGQVYRIGAQDQEAAKKVIEEIIS